MVIMYIKKGISFTPRVHSDRFGPVRLWVGTDSFRRLIPTHGAEELLPQQGGQDQGSHFGKVYAVSSNVPQSVKVTAKRISHSALHRDRRSWSLEAPAICRSLDGFNRSGGKARKLRMTHSFDGSFPAVTPTPPTTAQTYVSPNQKGTMNINVGDGKYDKVGLQTQRASDLETSTKGFPYITGVNQRDDGAPWPGQSHSQLLDNSKVKRVAATCEAVQIMNRTVSSLNPKDIENSGNSEDWNANDQIASKSCYSVSFPRPVSMFKSSKSRKNLPVSRSGPKNNPVNNASNVFIEGPDKRTLVIDELTHRPFPPSNYPTKKPASFQNREISLKSRQREKSREILSKNKSDNASLLTCSKINFSSDSVAAPNREKSAEDQHEAPKPKIPDEDTACVHSMNGNPATPPPAEPYVEENKSENKTEDNGDFVPDSPQPETWRGHLFSEETMVEKGHFNTPISSEQTSFGLSHIQEPFTNRNILTRENDTPVTHNSGETQICYTSSEYKPNMESTLVEAGSAKELTALLNKVSYEERCPVDVASNIENLPKSRNSKRKSAKLIHSAKYSAESWQSSISLGTSSFNPINEKYSTKAVSSPDPRRANVMFSQDGYVNFQHRKFTRDLRMYNKLREEGRVLTEDEKTKYRNVTVGRDLKTNVLKHR